MADDATAKDEARRRFVEAIDALNLRAQAEGPAPDSVARMGAVIVDHERKCAALAETESEFRRTKGEPRRRES